MPPTFRSSRSGRQFGDGANRTRTGQIDHDVFEGLPVRRWTRQLQTVSQTPKLDGQESFVEGPGGKQTIPEHPMPKDSHLLTPMSRALLRAARAGCIYIRKATKDAEDEEKEVTDVEEQPTLQTAERSFVTRKWTTVPRHLENSEVEFLAKRRPGLPSLYGATTSGANGAENGSAPMRRTRFKKVDPTSGNISIYEAWVPEGHKIEGEITDDSQLVPENSETIVTPEAPAPGTVIEGVGVVNAEGVVVADPASAAVMTPPKRRPPPPKRKAKGFGKGRRKKVMFAPGEGADANAVHGAGTGAVDGIAEPGYGKEDADRSQMSVDQNGQDEEEDDGEEGEESDEGDESMLDAKTPETPLHQPSAEPTNDPASGPVAEPVPTSTAPATESVVASQPPAPNPPAVASDSSAQAFPQPPAVPTMPLAPQQPFQSIQPSTDLPSSTVPPTKPTQELTPAEDVEMTDVNPDLPGVDTNAAPLTQTTPSTQQQATPQVIETQTETTMAAVPAQPQDIPRVTAPDPFPVVKSEDPTEKPLEVPPMEQTDLVVQAGVEDENVKLKPPASLPEMPPPEHAPQPEQALQPQQTTQPGQTHHPQPTHQLENTPKLEQAAEPEQASQSEQIPQSEPASHPEPAFAAQPAGDIMGNNESSLLDSLEASLGHAPGVEKGSEAQFGEQTEALSDHNAGHPSTETTQQPGSMEIDVDTMDPSTEPSLQTPAPQPTEPIEPVADQPPNQVPEIATGNSAEQAAELPKEHTQPPAETPIEPSIEPATQEFTQTSVEQPVEQPAEPAMEQTEPKAEEPAPVQVEEPLGEPQGAQQPEAQPEPISQQSSAEDIEPAPASNSEPPAAPLPEPPQETPIEQFPQPTEQEVAQPFLEAPVKPAIEQVGEGAGVSQPETTQPLQEDEPAPPQQPAEPQPPQAATPPAPTGTEDARPRPIETSETSETHDFTAPNFSPISDLNPELEKKEEIEAQPKAGEAGEPAPPGPDTVQNPSN